MGKASACVLAVKVDEFEIIFKLRFKFIIFEMMMLYTVCAKIPFFKQVERIYEHKSFASK